MCVCVCAKNQMTDIMSPNTGGSHKPAFSRLCRPLVATVVVVTNEVGGSDSWPLEGVAFFLAGLRSSLFLFLLSDLPLASNSFQVKYKTYLNCFINNSARTLPRLFFLEDWGPDGRGDACLRESSEEPFSSVGAQKCIS